jgi:hypothetical protein
MAGAGVRASRPSTPGAYNRAVTVPLARDTSPDVEQIQIDRWCRMSPAEKAALITGLTRAFEMARAGWLKDGREVSDRQWRDILGIISTQGSRLDRSYLVQHAPVPGVNRLLDLHGG